MKVWGLRSCLVVYSVRCSCYLSRFMPVVGVMGVAVLVLWVCGALLGVLVGWGVFGVMQFGWRCGFCLCSSGGLMV